jgi:hypothetical protein
MQLQRRIAGRTRLAARLITVQPGRNLLAPDRRILMRGLVFVFVFTVGRRGLRRRSPGASEPEAPSSSCGEAAAMRASSSASQRGEAAERGSEEQRQMSPQSGQGMNHSLTSKAEPRACRITTKTMSESKNAGGFCLPRRKRANFTTTAAGRSVRARFACAADGLVPTIFVTTIFVSAIFIAAILFR